MTDYPGVEILDEHIEALRLLLEGHPDAVTQYKDVTDDDAAVGHTTVIYSAFAVAVRRKFSPTFTKAQVIKYVADLRIFLGEDASQFHPRVAESMILAALGDETLKDREPYGADTSSLVALELGILVDLFHAARFDQSGLDRFLRETADHARRWLGAQQARDAEERASAP